MVIQYKIWTIGVCKVVVKLEPSPALFFFHFEPVSESDDQ